MTNLSMVGGTSNQSFPAQATLKVWIRKGEVRQVPTKGWARGVWGFFLFFSFFFFFFFYKSFLYFLSFLNTKMVHVNEILPCRRKGPVCLTLSIPGLLMTWQYKEPGHQQPQYHTMASVPEGLARYSAVLL